MLTILVWTFIGCSVFCQPLFQVPSLYTGHWTFPTLPWGRRCYHPHLTIEEERCREVTDSSKVTHTAGKWRSLVRTYQPVWWQSLNFNHCAWLGSAATAEHILKLLPQFTAYALKSKPTVNMFVGLDDKLLTIRFTFASTDGITGFSQISVNLNCPPTGIWNLADYYK